MKPFIVGLIVFTLFLLSSFLVWWVGGGVFERSTANGAYLGISLFFGTVLGSLAAADTQVNY